MTGEGGTGSGVTTVVGERQSWNGHRIRSFLERNIADYRWVEADSGEGRQLLESVSEPDRQKLPVVFFADGSVLANPSNVKLARGAGIATEPSREHYDLVIVGGGPAGLAAAVYGGSEGLSTAIIEREAPGGQAGQSSKIENYLGFAEGVTGAELTRQATIQTRRFGTDIVQPKHVLDLEPGDDGESVGLHLSDHSRLSATNVLIATGVQYRRLEAPGVGALIGAGVSYGASVSDAEHASGERVFVVGGANSAGQAAIHFASRCARVTILVRADSLAKSMSQYLIDNIEALDNVEVVVRANVVEAHGSERLEAITLARDGEVDDAPVPADRLLVFIGASPRTDWLDGVVARDEHGFIVTGRDLARYGEMAWKLDRDPYAFETNVPGVFVAGDVRRGSVKRVASAVGDGAMAVQMIHQYRLEHTSRG